MRLVERSAREADVLIPAISTKSGWHDYHRYSQYVEIGRASARAALPEIEALLEARSRPAPGAAARPGRFRANCLSRLNWRPEKTKPELEATA